MMLPEGLSNLIEMAVVQLVSRNISRKACNTSESRDSVNYVR